MQDGNAKVLIAAQVPAELRDDLKCSRSAALISALMPLSFRMGETFQKTESQHDTPFGEV
jgi:hypothetical protein